jgi:predicted nuclease with TOPRIM domain
MSVDNCLLREEIKRLRGGISLLRDMERKLRREICEVRDEFSRLRD